MSQPESDRDLTERRDEDLAGSDLLHRGLLAVAVVAAVAATARPTSAQADRPAFTAQDLDQMLAPIALYSDALLSQVLMAATYPLEVVEAARWSQANPNLKGDAAVAAVKDKSWDVSVKSLVAFPPILKQMNDQLEWTQKLGDAMLAQQADVADSIQRLRARAADAGNLKSSKEQAIKTETQGNDRVIVIEPADPQIVYAPSYDPNWAYGSWPYPSAPPYYWPFGGVLARGFLWGVGFAAAGAMFGGWNWGYGGGNSYVNVNVNRATNIDRNFNRNDIGNGDRWQHRVDHRKGVAYRDQKTRDRYGQNRPGADQRQQFRGQLQQPRASNTLPGGARPGGGPGAGGPGSQRPGGGPGSGPGAGQVQRPAQRPAQRPGQRPAQRGGGGLGGVNNGGRVNREAQRGRSQQQRSGGSRPSGGGGGGRQTAGGGGGRPGGGGGRPGGGGGRR